MDQITKQGYIERDGQRYALGSPEATNLLLSEGGLPSIPTTPPGQNPSGLLSFKDTISQVVNLAKEKRNASSLEFMAPHRGTVAASDFTGVLGNLNKASDTFAQDAIKNKLEADADKNLVSETIGNFEVLLDGTGKVIATRSREKGKGSDSPGKKIVVPGAPTFEAYVKAAEQVARMSFAPEARTELKKQYDEAYTTTDTSDLTDTETRKLEQAGLLNASRKEQLDFLYSKDDEIENPFQ